MSRPGAARSVDERTSVASAEDGRGASLLASTQALEAERSVLAAMLLDDSAIGRAMASIDASAFHRTAHALLFDALASLHRKRVPADLITVAEELKERGDLKAVGGSDFLAQVMESATTTANLEAHAHIVREASHRRRLKRMLEETAARANDPTATLHELLTDAESVTRDIREAGGRGVSRFADAAVTAPDLVEQTIEPPRSLLGDRVLTAGGLAILYGKPGLGKSWLAMDLARALVRGEPWLGVKTVIEGCRVGVVQLEQHDHAIQGRIRSLGIGEHERDGYLLLVFRPRLRGVVDLFRQPTDIEALRAWIEKECLDVIVIDALSRAHTASENKAEELGQVLASLDVLRHETGCTIVLVHHEPKEREGRDSENDLDALRGSSRLQSDPTLLVRVRQSRGMRFVRFVKVSEGPTPEDIYFMLGDDGVPQAVPSPEAVRDENRQRVLDAVLRAAQPVSRGDVEVITGLRRSAVSAHLKALADEGSIVVLGENQSTRYASPSFRPSGPSEQRATDGLSHSLLSGLRDSTSEPSASDPEPTVRPSGPSALKGGTVGRTVRLADGGPPDAHNLEAADD